MAAPTALLPIGTTDATSITFTVTPSTPLTLVMTGNIYNTTSPVEIFIEKENSSAVFEKVITMSNTNSSIILRGEGTYQARRPACPIASGLDLG